MGNKKIGGVEQNMTAKRTRLSRRNKSNYNQEESYKLWEPKM
jgi:hypothetical protein